MLFDVVLVAVLVVSDVPGVSFGRVRVDTKTVITRSKTAQKTIIFALLFILSPIFFVK